jgi:hypothetical protein
MKSSLLTILMSALLLTSPTGSLHQGEPSAARAQQPAVETDRIVSAFTAKETEFRNALAQYTFKRDAVVQSFGAGGQISGEYHRTSQLIFDDTGKRIEKILFFPMPTLTALGISSEDLDELGGVPLFALEASRAALYTFKYAGKERIDELDLYVFEVSPRSDSRKGKERLFQGRVWVDTQDYQIVKTRGKGIPEPKNRPYPTIEIYREEVDGFWFPTYAYADEELILTNGQPLRVRLRVRLSEFEKVSRK